jgi:HAD superfamily hydrolase (TIGR01509 family)
MDPALAEERLWDVYKACGLDGDVAFERFLQTTAGHVDPRVLFAGIRGYQRVKDALLEPYPRATWTLQELGRRGLTLAIITDAERPKALHRLAAARLLPFFDTVITLDDTLQGKADEMPYRQLLRKLALQPRDVLMVGDNPSRDVRPARKLGLWTAQALYGAQPHYATAFPFDQPDFKLRRIDELVAVVDQLRAPPAPASGLESATA